MTDLAARCGPCVECGQSVERDFGDLTGRWRERLERAALICDVCGERDEQAEREAEAQAEHERQARAREGRVAASGLPAELRGVRDIAPDPQRRDAIEAAESWATGELRGLVLLGPVGAGKTRIAAAAAWRLLDRRSARWYSAPVLLARLSASFDSRLRADALTTLAEGTQALVLDDLDKTRPTEYGAEAVFVALDSRVAEGAPLLATANATLGELARRWPEPYGEAIASRLAGYCRLVEVGGEDRRLSPPSTPEVDRYASEERRSAAAGAHTPRAGDHVPAAAPEQPPPRGAPR